MQAYARSLLYRERWHLEQDQFETCQPRTWHAGAAELAQGAEPSTSSGIPHHEAVPSTSATRDDLPEPLARRIVLTRHCLDRTASPRGKHLRMVCRRAHLLVARVVFYFCLF